jgi:polysaccharide pyruvyl transferase WcaK-like protein
MRILVDNGSYPLHNFGDVAMLQVAVGRLQSLFPESTVEVLTSAPDLLSRYCVGAKAVPSNGLRRWIEGSCLPGRFRAPRVLLSRLDAADSRFRDHLPEWSDRLALSRSRPRPADHDDVETFLAAMRNANLLVLAGGGYMTDVFQGHARSCFELLSRFQRRGIPTVMVGQGIGPLRDRGLLGRAKETLPRVGIIAIREGRAALPLLDTVGVSRSRIHVTGDDAIEPAFRARPSRLGNALGVNVRVSSYSGVDRDSFPEIRASLRETAAELRADLVPLPISRAKKDSDFDSLRELCGDGEAGSAWQELDSPSAVIQRVGECRVVVAGSYHAGLFALSQGIPVVGLTHSAYYTDKFLGLADQFGPGCRLVSLDTPGALAKVSASLRELWAAAEALRPQLLEAAKRQLDAGHRAYAGIVPLAGSRPGIVPTRVALTGAAG